MKIIDARWTSAVNLMVILCDCGRRFFHRADRRRVHCPLCRAEADIETLRQAIVPGQMECEEPTCLTSSADAAAAKSVAPSAPMSGGEGIARTGSSPRTQSAS